jgi:PilZ domain
VGYETGLTWEDYALFDRKIAYPSLMLSRLHAGATEMAALTKKREARKSLRQPGWITLEGGFAARQCVVQDISSTGAMITVDDCNALPARLRLAFARDARTGRTCAVVWQRGKSAGVKFVR